MNSQSRIYQFLIWAALLVGLDQLTKWMARSWLKGEEVISMLGDTFRLMYVENTGAFLSMGSGLPRPVNFFLFSILPILFMAGIAVFVFLRKDQLSRMGMIALTLIFAGGLGNLVDRIVFHSHVTDFLNLGIGNLRTGIFNVADMYVTAGVILIVLYYKSAFGAEEKPPAGAQKDQA